MKELNLEDFPLITFDKIRYADTDRQGHVNNANFSSFLETGRVEVLYNTRYPILVDSSSFVIASLKLEFLNEITWPGEVNIGTGVLKIGNSSMTIFQRLFQENKCVANAETVIVQVDNVTRRSSPLTDTAKNTLYNWLLNDVD
ncbi:MAG TPA: thioesterase family protein [Anaerolineales bacterium]|nr:thioesterase [Anaerolineae bacterium]HRJ55817.1 thioesterase family protein [Anaerolineales bacterium]HRK91323.1 thioesterase family protein [Anaerolineales bacterium]